MHSYKKDNCSSCCRHFCNWFAQISVIATLVLLIISLATNDDGMFGGSLGSFIFCYILYIIISFCSPTFRYLINKHKADSIHQHMKNLYYTAPTLTFHAECYHYNTYYYTERDSNGNTHTRSRTEKVVTHREYENFRFCSWRDVSGLFLLDSEKFLQEENSKKVYIKLALDLEFDFADNISRYDYEMQKSQFKFRNIYRDVHMDFSESLDVPGFTPYNMVRISDYRPACLNCCVYLIFTFLIPLGEFYKMYVNSFCIQQDYTIRKTVSTRFNINANEEEFMRRYENNTPRIIIYGQETSFNEAPTDFNKVYDLPTQEELEESTKYSSSKIGSSFNKKSSETLNKNDFQNISNTNINYNTNMMQGGSSPMMQGGSIPMMQGGSAPMMQGGSIPMMQGGSIPMMQGGSIPMMQGGTAPMMQTNDQINDFPMMQNGSNPIITGDSFKDYENDLEKKLLEKK